MAMREAVPWAVSLAFLFVLGGHAQQQKVPPQKVNPSQSSAVPPMQQGVLATPADQEVRGDILMAQKHYAEAAVIYQNLVAQQPRNSALLNKLGIAYHQQSMLDQAKRYYDRASRADRTNANAINNVGTIHYQRKNYRKAVNAYRKALEIRSDMAAVHSNLGYAYFAQKRFPEALAAFQHALELDPGVFERSNRVGSLLQDRTVTDRGLFNFFLAKSFATLGNAERCAHYLRKARDESYKDLASAKTDPAFANVLRDPAVREVLQLPISTDDKLSAPPKPPQGS